MTNKETLDAIRQRLEHAGRIVVTAHMRPDGDAVGSVLALGLALQDQGKQVQTRNYLSQALELVHKINAQDLEQRINHRLEAISIR